MPKKHIMRALFSKLLIFVLMCGVFFTSSVAPAYAQWATTNPDTLANDLAGTIQKETKGQVKGALLGALAGIGISLLDYVATLTAQSTAVWIANGAAGKHPLFNSQTMEEVGTSVAGSVVSDVLDEIVPGSGALAALGLDPNNPDLTGVLRKMLGSSYKPVDLTEDGRMDGGSIGRNFSSYIASTAALTGASEANDFTAKILSDTMNASSTNEFYGLLRSYGQTTARAENLASKTEFQNIIKDGFQDLKSPISKKTKWPAANVKKKLDDAIANKQQNDADVGKGLVQAAGENAVIQVGINFLTTFAGTLFGELTNKLFSGLLDGIDPVTVNPFDPTQVVPGRSGEELFRSLGTFRPLVATGFSLTAQLASCPATLLRNTRGIYTCAMDTAFVSVVARGNSNNPATLEDAIASGEINGNWPMVGPDSAANKSPNCYQNAYCHSNLLKLRKARIIPIGWEMAATLSGEGKFTLQQVMDGFYDCNEDGGRDSEHEFCKLIDPKWVLRAPTAVCRTLAYGQQLATSAGPNRLEECVDIQTCLDEDENGECKGGYGYCVREANIWRFRGDVCSEENASCQALTDRAGKKVSYLLNTVDYSTCGPDKVGCQWFETAKTVDAEGDFNWPVVNDVAADAAEDFTNQSRVYANANIETCEEGGCHELIARAGGLTLNMVQNGSFEDDKNSDGTPDGWLRGPSVSELKPGKGVANGIALEAQSVTYPGLVFEPGRAYTISFSAKAPVGESNMGVNAEVLFTADNPQDDIGTAFVNFTGYTVQGLNGTTCTSSGDIVTLERALVAGEDYVRAECLITVPNLPDTIRRINGALTLAADFATPLKKAWFDDVQIEQRGQVSSYAFGYSANAPKAYAKIAPAYLGCSGSASDAAECANYAKVCSPLDEGCQQYTPTNGDPAVNAIVGEGNACPAVCTGYDTFKQEPTLYEPDGVFPEYFIAATADTCTAEAAGCDEFTNLTTEGLEYFTYLRGCLSPERSVGREAVYYTWEGSDVEGYQIKTWNLLKTNIAYAVNMTSSTGSPVFDANAKDAPCTTWEASATGITCTDDAAAPSGVLDSMDSTCDAREDIYSNSDCREFYDSLGQIHYRLWTNTVSVNAACTSYRKTDIAGETEAAQTNNCEASGGYFAEGGGSCIYYGFTNESKTCSAAENGCRVYTGGRGNNARTVFEDLFEKDGSTIAGVVTPAYLPGWDSGDSANVARSTESLANEGHSLKVMNGETFWTYYANWGASCGTADGCLDHVSEYEEQCRIVKGEQFCGTLHEELFTGKTYTLQFWAKGAGTLKVGFAENAASNELAPAITAGDEFKGANGSTDLVLTSEWKEYRVGPIDMNAKTHPNFGIGSVLVFDPSAGATVYVDTISLREGEENLALIRDSWSTPAVCDTDSVGRYAPQFNLGCREYTSSAGSLVYLKSFSRLCGEDKVGCAAFYDTQASESPYGQVFNAYCNRVVTVAGQNAKASELFGVATYAALSASQKAEVDAAMDDSATECRLEGDLNSVDGYAANAARLCTLQPNQATCRFNLDFLLPETALGSGLRTAHIVYEADTEVVSPDAPIYAVVNSGSQCNSAEAGCTQVGIPVLSADQSRVESWGDVSLLLDPDSYGTTLCRGEDLFCEEFNDARKNKYYFKDPQQKVCEFKEKVVISGQEYSGWFVQGTTNFCYGEGKCETNTAAKKCGGTGSVCTLDTQCAEGITCDPIVCTLDSDCPVIGNGTCSVFGTACSQDEDCRLNERCLGVESDKCVIDSGSYVISGTESGLWLTGDDLYKGWAGTCSAENSGCREFLDPLDSKESDTPYGQSDVKAYYYIENENLGDVSVGGTTQRCNGQASTEEGCVLFYDTSLPRLTMSTTATAIASQHADELFGTRQYALVPPINCNEGAVRSSITTPSNSRVDLCSNRCAYDRFKVEDIGDNWDEIINATGASGQDGIPDAEFNSLNDFMQDGGALTASTLEKGYIFGGSCLVDTDCAPVRSEAGDLIDGSCRSAAPNDTVGGVLTTLPVPRLENDTNRVIKVNRNRTCSEWIAPDDCRKVWDPELNQFRQSCSRLVLCEEYDETGVFACKKPKMSDAAVPINLDFYTSRDASWYGNEYSGYAIGSQFLLNHLTQEQTNLARVCVTTVDEVKTIAESPVDSGNPVECDDTSDCSATLGAVCEPNPDPEFALVYNAGSCKDQASNTSCQVGSCADSGATCATGDQCPGSSCIIGSCIIPTDDTCVVDADCGTAVGSVCVAGKCEIEVGANCLIADADDGAVKGCNIAAEGAGFGSRATNGATCRLETSSYKSGTCINDKCLLTPVGAAYPKTTVTDSTVETFGKVCRANPEADSPFATDIVERWNIFKKGTGDLHEVADGGDAPDAGEYPYNMRSGFENANICAAGEACACSYKKITASGQTGYIEINSDVDTFANIVAAQIGAPTGGDLGICSGGAASGAFCIIDSDKEYGCKANPEPPTADTAVSGSFGTCNPIQREDDLVGLRGYCLERDSAVNIDGDQNLGACLTYFPIDELRGETDLYGKFKEAGFFEDAFYCGEIKNYANVSSIRGCSADRGSSGMTQDNLVRGSRSKEQCQYTVVCPSGYWAAVGPKNIDTDTTNSEAGTWCDHTGTMDGDESDGEIDLWARTDEAAAYDQANGCPYVCVPKNSFHATDDGPEPKGSACTPPPSAEASKKQNKNDRDIGYKTDYYYSEADSTTGKKQIDAWWDEYQDCTYYGMDIAQDELGVNAFYSVGYGEQDEDYPTSYFGADWGTANSSYVVARQTNHGVGPFDCTDVPEDGVVRKHCEDFAVQVPYERSQVYPACSGVVQASSSDANTGFFYTNRIYASKTITPGTAPLVSFSVPIESPSGTDGTAPLPAYASYNDVTSNFPYGATISPLKSNQINYVGIEDPHPLVIPTCVQEHELAGGLWSLVLRGLVSAAPTETCVNPYLGAQYERSTANWVSNFGIGGGVEAMPYISLGLIKSWGAKNAVQYPEDAGVNTTYLSPLSEMPKIQTLETFEDAAKRMKTFFAKGYRWWSFSNGTPSLVAGGAGIGSYGPSALTTQPDYDFDDRKGGNGYIPEPPKVYSVDLNNCIGRNCREGGENQISVNSKIGEDFLVDTDGFFRASVEFFAAASKEQLPIRRIIVDWGNGTMSGSDEPDNFYKNFRGLDKNADDVPFCNTNREWGMTEDSCEPTWLRYTKTYVCDDTMENTLPVCDGDDVNCYNESAQECIFQPKVHVRDNWGWCTGQCDGHDAGCFSSQGLTSGTTDASNQCNYQYFPHGATKVDPWVKYSGIIRIKKN